MPFYGLKDHNLYHELLGFLPQLHIVVGFLAMPFYGWKDHNFYHELLGFSAQIHMEASL